ncbi:hypothetical protein ABPG72_005592 [Tetrahymena utriculariae]
MNFFDEPWLPKQLDSSKRCAQIFAKMRIKYQLKRKRKQVWKKKQQKISFKKQLKSQKQKNKFTQVMSTNKRKQLYKIIILGDSGVGKTSLMNQYVNQRFTQQYRATVGADFMAKEVTIDDRMVTLQTFENLESWKEEFKQQGCPKDPDTFPFVVIGNKSDKASERKVETEFAQQWCKSNGDIKHFETSAKDDTNVNAAFMAIAKAASSQFQEDAIFFPSKPVVLQTDKAKKKEKQNDCPC